MKGLVASRPLAILVALAIGLGGCSMRTGLTAATAQRPPLGSPADVAQAVTYWGERFNRGPGDEQAAFAYSRALLAQDQRAQAVAVLQKAVVANSASKFLQGELGKALAANGQLQEALAVFEQAHTPDHPDWRILSAQGAVYDQLGRSDEARKHYEAALHIAPNEPAILTNLGLSYALSGDLPAAERQLRLAVATGHADQKARQNLAIVVGLQGRFPEAEALAQQDLPPAEAEANIAIIRRMVAQANTWSTIQNRNVAQSAPQPASADVTASIRPRPAGVTPQSPIALTPQ